MSESQTSIDFADRSDPLAWFQRIADRYEQAEKRGEIRVTAGQKPFDTGSAWIVNPDSGVPIQRSDGGFFNIQAAHIQMGVDDEFKREVGAWDQPLAEEAHRNAVLLLIRQDRDQVEALCQAKWAPGNASPGRILLAPTIEASISNLEKVHGGKHPQLHHLWSDHTLNTRYEGAQPVDGTRFLKKINTIRVATDTADRAETQPDQLPVTFCWFTLKQIAELNLDGQVNENLLVALSKLQALEQVGRLAI